MMDTGKLLAVVLLVWSCNATPDGNKVLDPGDLSDPTIHFTAMGGYGGGLLLDIAIDPEGLASYNNFEPIFELQLTDEEHTTILNLFDGFENLDSIYYSESICPDDVYYTIEYGATLNETETVNASGCGLDYEGDTSLVKIIGSMYALADTIYQRQAPWLGLTLDVSLDNDIYALNDTITLIFSITNPTDKERALYFSDGRLFSFYGQKSSDPGFAFSSYGLFAAQSQEDQVVINLQPGEIKNLMYRWDQRWYDAGSNYRALEIGTYTIKAGLTAGFLPGSKLSFEIIDISIPLGGYIITNWAERSSASPTKTFYLLIHNYTSERINLHFPYEQKLHVQLFEPAYPQPAYEGPSQLLSAPSSQELASGDTLVFEYSVPKSDISLTYSWPYSFGFDAKVSLLITDFEFVRYSELTILMYSP
ncbi:BsuPI-related putative proteinase inhibitor [Candidatus Neomarinimicrobiota bacterium]